MTVVGGASRCRWQRRLFGCTSVWRFGSALNRLEHGGIHNRFIDMPDADNIIILADDKVYFDLKGKNGVANGT